LAINHSDSITQRLGQLHAEIVAALENGRLCEARLLMAQALQIDSTTRFAESWRSLWEIETWPDGWLIAAIRVDNPDTAALDALADRYWRSVFGRCQMLTLDRDEANDLAQAAWCRALRSRQRLRTDGDFLAYLSMIATNLWRDSQRASRRAGPIARDRLVSLNTVLPADDGTERTLSDLVPDINALQADAKKLLMEDIDRALGELTPLLHDVLVARFISGESCAEIARRYERTEQTVSAWVRQAVQEMKQRLSESRRLRPRKEQS
jgi:RNA polymerase sigma factor (sigma-70 family)